MDNIIIEGPSPDEIAILNGSKDICGYVFKRTAINMIGITSSGSPQEDVKILWVNKFTNARRMMSVIIKSRK